MASRKKSSGGGRAPAPTATRAGAPETAQGGADPGAPTGPGGSDGATPRAWAGAVMIAALAVGLGVAVHLVRMHLAVQGLIEGFEAGCGDQAGWDCEQVNASRFGAILGIPTALPAIPTYLLLIGLAALGMRGRGELGRKAPAYAFAISILTVVYSAFLFGVSQFVLQQKCIWCVTLYGVHVVTLATSWLLSRRSPGELVRDVLGDLARAPARPAAMFAVFAALLVVAVGVEKGVAHRLEAARVASAGGVGGAPSVSASAAVPGRSDGGPEVSADDPFKGPPDAAVRVVEFADFECGYCKRMSYVLADLVPKYKDRVQFVWKDFPMNPECNPGVKNRRHADACVAAAAGRCAHTVAGNDGFWRWHDLAFKNQHRLGRDDLIHYAELAGIDRGRFTSCLSDPASMERVRRNGAQGQELGLDGTPRIFVGGQLFKGIQSPQVLVAAIEKALGATPQDAQATARAAKEAAAQDGGAAEAPAQAPEMREVRYGRLHFRIDTFEGAIASGRAVSKADQVPALRTSWYAAKEACEAAGKRMCSEEEWVAACQGAAPVDDDGNGVFADDYLEGTEFPYGDYYQPGACADQGDAEKTRPLYTGSKPRCRSRDGVFDLAGNAQEWVGTTEDSATLIGGAWYFKEKARCYQRHDKFGPGYTTDATGFRCCQDAR